MKTLQILTRPRSYEDGPDMPCDVVKMAIR